MNQFADIPFGDNFQFAAHIQDVVFSSVELGILASTGNGTVHQALDAALLRAQAAGVAVVRATRCTQGRILPTAASTLPSADGLSPVKARVAMVLELMAADCRAAA